jgi:hypothetical protein
MKSKFYVYRLLSLYLQHQRLLAWWPTWLKNFLTKFAACWVFFLFWVEEKCFVGLGAVVFVA